MSILCIAGPESAPLFQIAGQLAAAGLPFPEDQGRAIAQWQRDVLQQLPDLAENGSAGTVLAQVWQDEALALLQGDEDAHWGWADSDSTWLLDLWSRIRPDTVFLLCCLPPEYALARAIQAPSVEAPDLQAVLTGWMTCHSRLLRFRHRHPQRSLLVDASKCLADGAQLVQTCSETFGVPLKCEPGETPFAERECDPIALHLARAFLDTAPEAQALYAELEASLTPLTDHDQAGSGSQDRTEAAVIRFRALERACQEGEQQLADAKKDGELLLTKLHEAQEELEKTLRRAQQAERERSELEKSRDAQARLLTERQNEITTLTATRTALQTSLADLTQARDTLAREKNELAQARDVQAKLASERQAQITALTGEKAAAERIRNELAAARDAAARASEEQRKENDLLLLQLHQVQEELEQLFLDSQSFANEKAELARAAEAQAKIAAELQVEAEALRTANEAQRRQEAQVRAELAARIEAVNEARRALKSALDNTKVLRAENEALAAELADRKKVVELVPMKPAETSAHAGTDKEPAAPAQATKRPKAKKASAMALTAKPGKSKTPQKSANARAAR